MAPHNRVPIEASENKCTLNGKIENCRICNINSNLITLPKDIYRRFEIFSKIEVLACPDNKLAELICLKCLIKLRKCVQFYKNVLKAEQRLQELLSAHESIAEDTSNTLADPFNSDEENFKLAPNPKKPRTKVDTIYNDNPTTIFTNYISCDDCGINLNNISQLYKHRKEHNKISLKQLKRTKQPRRFKSHNPLKRKRTDTSKKKKYHVPCEACSTTILTSSGYFLECTQCNHTFSNCSALLFHFRYQHKAIMRFICLDCINSFSNVTQFKEHLRFHKFSSTHYHKLLNMQEDSVNTLAFNNDKTPNFWDNPLISVPDIGQLNASPSNDTEMTPPDTQKYKCINRRSSNVQLLSPGNQSSNTQNDYYIYPSECVTAQQDKESFRMQSCVSQSSSKNLVKDYISLFDLAPLACLKFDAKKLSHHINSNREETGVCAQNKSAVNKLRNYEELVVSNKIERIKTTGTLSIQDADLMDGICRIREKSPISNEKQDNLLLEGNTDQVFEPYNFDLDDADVSLVEVVKIIESEDIPSNAVRIDPEVIVIEDNDDSGDVEICNIKQFPRKNKTCKDVIVSDNGDIRITGKARDYNQLLRNKTPL